MACFKSQTFNSFNIDPTLEFLWCCRLNEILLKCLKRNKAQVTFFFCSSKQIADETLQVYKEKLCSAIFTSNFSWTIKCLQIFIMLGGRSVQTQRVEYELTLFESGV